MYIINEYLFLRLFDHLFWFYFNASSTHFFHYLFSSLTTGGQSDGNTYDLRDADS